MADLARLAGVSPITVSRALADSRLVNDDTKARIQALARDHGYALNVTARNLRLRRSHTIAVILDMVPSPERPMSGAYPLDLLGGITQELAPAGYSLLLRARDGAATPATQLAEGVILLGQGARDEAVHAVDRWRMPTVIWGAVGDDAGHVVVGSDNRGGGASVARHFLAQGKRRPCFIGSLAYAENEQRFAGFRETLAGHDIDSVCVQGVDFTTRAGASAMAGLLTGESSDWPDAVFACNDLLAIGALQSIREAGLRVPGQISVAGFDDTALGASLVPALTSVRQDLYRAGMLLARKVLAMVDGGEQASEVLPTELIVRET